ncbi:MAG: type 1 glutamine amidotransferase, partial [Candidatus Omnitrophota bacterium]|nr:type 1 glutamine amidotransferase [Candidatus Omnitrophota bacterium]
MRIHYLQHVPFEGIANISKWAKAKNHTVSGSLVYENQSLPMVTEFDSLVIMGGPMGVYEDDKYPWLSKEKKYIEKAIKAEKLVFGVCLGAQLIADVLGAKVYKNQYKEIGWYDVTLTGEAKTSSVFSNLEKNFVAFHWHGDTFDIPAGAKRLAET